MDFKTGPGLQALIYIASKSSSILYCFTITSLVPLNWQAEKGFEIYLSESKKVERGVQNNRQEKEKRKLLIFNIRRGEEKNPSICGHLKSLG